MRRTIPPVRSLNQYRRIVFLENEQMQSVPEDVVGDKRRWPSGESVSREPVLSILFREYLII